MAEWNMILPPQVLDAIERLEARGFEAYVVGGCVRNAFLGLAPNDWDLTTSALPEQTASCFTDLKTVETGIRHGTLTVLYDKMPLEITTFRNDGEYLDNRHPAKVTFSKRIEDDLCRRDFTVNAMAYHPQRGVVDLFGGREDLARRVITCVGKPTTRFNEDGLRILRALRFAAVLDFTIEEKTARAVHDCAYLLGNIAAERIREEFCKLICGKGAVRILREYHDVIGQFLPELSRCVGFAQNTKYHCYDVFEHTLHALEMAPADPLLRLAVLLHDIGKPLCYTEDEQGGHFKGHAEAGVAIVREITSRLRFDNRTAERLITLVEYHDRDIPPIPKSVKRLMRRMSDEDISILMEVKRCDRLAHAPDYCELSPALEEIPRLVRRIREAGECLSLKTLQIGGEDLMALGVPKGRQIGILLDRLLEQVLDGALPNDRDALIEAARQMIDSSL